MVMWVVLCFACPEELVGVGLQSFSSLHPTRSDERLLQSRIWCVARLFPCMRQMRASSSKRRCWIVLSWIPVRARKRWRLKRLPFRRWCGQHLHSRDLLWPDWASCWRRFWRKLLLGHSLASYHYWWEMALRYRYSGGLVLVRREARWALLGFCLYVYVCVYAGDCQVYLESATDIVFITISNAFARSTYVS